VDAKFSLPYCIALAAVHGDVRISDFRAGQLEDPAVLAMAAKIVPVPDDSRNWTSKSPEGRIEIVTTGGKTIDRCGDNVPGSPEAPLAWADLERKFSNCAAMAARPLHARAIDCALSMVRHLENLQDIEAIFPNLQTEQQ
jgi:2-methylcitrate dehydratase PrpD